MLTTRNLVVAAITGVSLAAVVLVSGGRAQAEPAVNVQAANPTITITNQGASPAYLYSPAQLEAKAGQTITVTNKDPNGVHAVTAKDNSFSVDVPPDGTVTLTVSKPGTYPYYCTYHPTDHNEASLIVS